MAGMRLMLLALLLLQLPATSPAQVLPFADLNTRDVERLDRSKTVIIIPGAILEQHGPYLPVDSDGIFNRQLAHELAAAIANRGGGWKAVLLPSIPLGAGAANEIGRKYSFPGSCTVRPSTLRAIFMDMADQLGSQNFRWVIVVHGHGDPAHNRMLDEAADYFHDTYGGEMVNLFGYLWAAERAELRTAAQRKEDGLAEHATMMETSVILALQPKLVAADYKSAPAQTAHSMQELEKVASSPRWPGYFGAPALASAELGGKIYEQWFTWSKDFVFQILDGHDYRKLTRYADLYADDPADKAAEAVNQRFEAQHEAWLKRGAAQKSR